MNITEALNQVLPEIPAKIISQRFPRLHPEVVFKEQVQDGEVVVRAFVPGVEAIFNFTPQNWTFVQQFNGLRSYTEVAEFYAQATGIQYNEEEVRELAENLESMDFWYKTPLEKNVALMQKTAAERRKMLRQKKHAWGDLSMLTFPAVNPDKFLDWVHEHGSFIYTWWFTLITLAAFLFMGGIFVTHWGEVGHDTFQFYNFADKTWGDVAAFWLLATVLMCIHEVAHGLTCKHYGGHVRAMGFALIYLSPAFFTDTTEGMVTGSRHQRLMISVSGVWSELMVCAIFTPLWWGTAPGTALHDFAYTIILITGIGVVLINWNPLMKLDGYHMLCEILGVGDLKETSTIYVSSWVKRHIWRLPVEVPYVPKRRRLGFTIYALLSGIYSYTVLYILARFVGNAFRNFNPDWSFIPELATAGIIFRSRIRTLVNFMKFFYLDKKDRIRAWFTPRHSFVVAAAMLIVMILPVWHETAEGRFRLEPVRTAMVRAMVPGTVTAVYASEGQPVVAGEPLARLRNLALESKLEHNQADLKTAATQVTSAVLRYTGSGAALQDRERLNQQQTNLASARANLELKSPLSGIVLTPRPNERVGAYIPEGTELIEVGDVSRLNARVYVSEPDMHIVGSESFVRLQVEGTFGIRKARRISISPASTEIEAGLIDMTKYEGLRAPKFYVLDLLVENGDGAWKPGQVGTARIYGQRKTLAGLAWGGVASFVGRKVW